MPARPTETTSNLTGIHCISTAKPIANGFYEERSFSVQYVIAESETRECAIIDPIFDFDEKPSVIATRSGEQILTYVKELGFEMSWVLDTYPHADHFSAAQYRKKMTGAPTATGKKVMDVQKLWKASKTASTSTLTASRFGNPYWPSRRQRIYICRGAQAQPIS